MSKVEITDELLRTTFVSAMQRLTRRMITQMFAVEGIVITEADWDFIDSIKDLPPDQQMQRIKERARGQT